MSAGALRSDAVLPRCGAASGEAGLVLLAARCPDLDAAADLPHGHAGAHAGQRRLRRPVLAGARDARELPHRAGAGSFLPAELLAAARQQPAGRAGHHGARARRGQPGELRDRPAEAPLRPLRLERRAADLPDPDGLPRHPVLQGHGRVRAAQQPPGAVFAMATFAIPYAIWVLRQYADSDPVRARRGGQGRRRHAAADLRWSTSRFCAPP